MSVPDELRELVALGLSDRQVGERLGVSSRTIIRWRQSLGLASQWMPTYSPCGTPAAYRAGCTCEACRAAHTAAQGIYRRAINERTARTARRAYERWTPDEDAIALALTPLEAVRVLGRSREAVLKRRDVLQRAQRA